MPELQLLWQVKVQQVPESQKQAGFQRQAKASAEEGPGGARKRTIHDGKP